MRYWKPEDIFTVACPHCHVDIEFWKDEPVRLCPGCGKEVRNPKTDLGCAEHCKHGPECLEHTPENTGSASVKNQPPAAEGPR